MLFINRYKINVVIWKIDRELVRWVCEVSKRGWNSVGIESASPFYPRNDHVALPSILFSACEAGHFVAIVINGGARFRRAQWVRKRGLNGPYLVRHPGEMTPWYFEPSFV